MNSTRTHARPPATRESTARWLEREGFVDEEVVANIIAAPHSRRASGQPDDLALAADDMDFAGWNLPAFVRTGPPEILAEPTAPVAGRLPAPPVPPWRREAPVPAAGRRWWLAALAGVIATLLVSAVVVALALGAKNPFSLPPAGDRPAPPHGAAPLPPAPGD